MLTSPIVLMVRLFPETPQQETVHLLATRLLSDAVRRDILSACHCRETAGLHGGRVVRNRTVQEEEHTTFESKWGWGAFVDAGWCPLPVAFLMHAQSLGITPHEGWVITHLLCFKWVDREPNPPLPALLRRTGMAEEELMDCLESLQAKGLLRIAHRPSGDGRAGMWEFDLSPMFRLVDEQAMRGVGTETDERVCHRSAARTGKRRQSRGSPSSPRSG